MLGITYRTGEPDERAFGNGHQFASDLALLDSLATRWGHCGEELARTLWAWLQ